MQRSIHLSGSVKLNIKTLSSLFVRPSTIDRIKIAHLINLSRIDKLHLIVAQIEGSDLRKKTNSCSFEW